jgi:hypothetical protein
MRAELDNRHARMAVIDTSAQRAESAIRRHAASEIKITHRDWHWSAPHAPVPPFGAAGTASMVIGSGAPIRLICAAGL